MEEIRGVIAKVCKDLFKLDVEVELTRPNEQFGDYSTNVALKLAGQLNKNPRDIADQLAKELKNDAIVKVEVAGPGFLNIYLTDETLWQLSDAKLQLTNQGKEILVEFGDPNPFKEMHIGHVYSYIVGDSIAKILESTGATVRRLSYHGDVGLHVAKALWAMQKKVVNPDSTVDALRVDIGFYYAKGAKAYEEDEQAKEEIHKINELIYKNDPELKKLYEWGKAKSFGYFSAMLEDLDIVENDKQYMESETADIGIEAVKANLGTVFKESEGAIIYDGEKIGLHKRVFITSKGLPTYETKDLGLAELKKKDFPRADRSIIITANEQAEYFKVMLAALAEFDKPLSDSITHISHGFVSLSTGKMSSRTGNVLRGTSAIVDIDREMKKLFPDATQATRNAAIKYDFLKHRLGTDIVYDVEQSFSIEGNSGPYLQYAHARACSILTKAKSVKGSTSHKELDKDERSLLRKIGEYTEVVNLATKELMPHHICTYLYELAQNFNRFYEHSPVIGHEREALRITLVKSYADVLKQGLNLLGITPPEKM